MADNECCFVGQNHAWILRGFCVYCAGPNMELMEGAQREMAAKLSFQSLLQFTDKAWFTLIVRIRDGFFWPM